MSISTVPPSSSACISSYMRCTYPSTTFATHISIAHGAAESVAPMKPSGAILLS